MQDFVFSKSQNTLLLLNISEHFYQVIFKKSENSEGETSQSVFGSCVTVASKILGDMTKVPFLVAKIL